MSKYTKKHNQMAWATGERKQHNKLVKSKHGWLKVAMGTTFASAAILGAGHVSQVHADTTPTNPQQDNSHSSTTQAPEQVKAGGNVVDLSAKPSDSNSEKVDETVDKSKAVTDSSQNTATDDSKDATTEDAKATLVDANVKTVSDSKTDAQTTSNDKEIVDNVVQDKTAPVLNQVKPDATTGSDNDKQVKTDKSAMESVNDKQTKTDQVVNQADPKTDNTSDTSNTTKEVEQPKADSVNKEDKTTTSDSQNASDSKTASHVDDSVNKTADTAQPEKTNSDSAKAAVDDSKTVNDVDNTEDNNDDESDANQTPDANSEKVDADSQTPVETNQPVATPQLQSRAAAVVNLAQGGNYTLSGAQNVRDGASLNSNITDQLAAGTTIHWDYTNNADGYKWLHFDDNGQSRWVAQMVATSNSNQAFIDSMAAGAQETWNQYGILPSVSIAQAICESNWGKAAPGNNLFGIKGSYNGQSVTVPTQEWVGDHYVTIYDQFRAYPSFAESIMDHGNFLTVNSRYSNLHWVTDYAAVCRMLQADGYATSPTYASTLISIINSNDLTRFDNGPVQPQPSNPDNNQGQGQPVSESGAYTMQGDQNVRDGASLSANITKQLPDGYTIYYDSAEQNDGYNWLHYTNYAGESRWVAQLNGQADPTPQTPSTSNNMTPASGTYTMNGDQNVRDGASVNANITKQLPSGYTIYYDGTEQNDGYNWLHYTNYAGESRWVAQLNGQADPTPQTPSTSNNMTPASGAYTMNGDQNVRDGASVNANITKKLPSGYTIYYDGTTQADGYTWLHYNNYAGESRWVAQLNGSMASDSQPVAIINHTSGSYSMEGTQNVRDDASLSANITTQLPDGYTIYYDGTREADGYTWLHYTNYAGESRWVVQGDGVPANTSTSNTISESGSYVVSQPQNIRDNAGLSSNVVNQARPGDVIYYDSKVEMDGVVWLHYISFSGIPHYIAEL